jgi:hypothetical protein
MRTALRQFDSVGTVLTVTGIGMFTAALTYVHIPLPTLWVGLTCAQSWSR